MTHRIAELAQLAATPLLLWTGACGMTDSCIAAGSRVATPDGWLAIELLQPGDAIYAVDVATGALVVSEVTLVRRSQRECVALVGAAGQRLCLTPDHPVYSPGHAGFVAAGRFVLGQATRVLNVGSPEVEVDPELRAEVGELGQCSTYAGVHAVFDLSVAGAHPTFVAEGFVVHNKTIDPSSTSSVTVGDPPPTGTQGSSSGDSSGTMGVPTTGGSTGESTGGTTGESTGGTTVAGSSSSGASSTGEATEGGSSSGGAEEGSTGAAADLVIDPSTLVVFELPINSLRYGVGGFDAEHGTCVTVIFTYPGEEKHCDDFMVGDDAGFPYVVITPNAAPPCTDWDYQGNVQLDAAAGCMQLTSPAPPEISLTMQLEVSGAPFTGSIAVSNE